MSKKPHPPAHELPWLEGTRARLFELWRVRTGHHATANAGTWACEIAVGCRDCGEHLSLPCSLLREANEIGLFLGGPIFTDSPGTFFRFYLILLSEFVHQLEDLSHLLGIRIGKPPKQVSVWANRWAKHRLHLLVQHHPEIVFADEEGDGWPEVERELKNLVCIDRCGRQRPAVLIDWDWLCSASGKNPDLSLANGEKKAVIVVPPMEIFLQEAMDYFRAFIDAALLAPNAVRQFRSEHAALRC